MIVPSVDKKEQVRLFEAALAAIGQRNDVVNTLVEVFENGHVEVREWTSDHHDPVHVSPPPATKPEGSGEQAS